MFVQKVFKTNFNFRYQRENFLKKRRHLHYVNFKTWYENGADFFPISYWLVPKIETKISESSHSGKEPKMTFSSNASNLRFTRSVRKAYKKKSRLFFPVVFYLLSLWNFQIKLLNTNNLKNQLWKDLQNMNSKLMQNWWRSHFVFCKIKKQQLRIFGFFSQKVGRFWCL